MLCVSFLRKPTFTAELWVCKEHDTQPVATTLWEGAAPKFWTETDFSIEVAKMGGPEQLRWERLHFESKFYRGVPRLMIRILRRELLDVEALTRAENEMQHVKRAQRQFEQCAVARPNVRRQKRRHPRLVAVPAANAHVFPAGVLQPLLPFEDIELDGDDGDDDHVSEGCVGTLLQRDKCHKSLSPLRSSGPLTQTLGLGLGLHCRLFLSTRHKASLCLSGKKRCVA